MVDIPDPVQDFTLIINFRQQAVPLRHIPVPVQIQPGAFPLHLSHIFRQLILVQKLPVPVRPQIDGLRLVRHRKFQGKTAVFASWRGNSLLLQISGHIAAFCKLRRSQKGSVGKLRLQGHALHAVIGYIPAGHLHQIRLVPDCLISGDPLKQRNSAVFIRLTVEIDQRLHLVIGRSIGYGLPKRPEQVSQIALSPGRHIGGRHRRLPLQKALIKRLLDLVPDLQADLICHSSVLIIACLLQSRAENPEYPAVPDLPVFRVALLAGPDLPAALDIGLQFF